jgi:phosphate transport system substrate-binding protein
MHVPGIRASALLLTTIGLLSACGAEAPAPSGGAAATGALAPFATLEGTLDVAGGTAHVPVMEKAAAQIMKANSRIRITVAAGGSGKGVEMVGEGIVQIGNTGRPVSDAERTKYGLVSFPFAIDGVAVAVHPANPVKALTSEQARAVFAGTVTNWRDLGGRDAPIDLYGRDEASGTREVFWTVLLKKGEIADRTNVVASNGAMKTAIAGDEDAIGYLGIGHLDASVAAVVLDGMVPTQENARSGAYTVTRNLFMNTKGEPVGLVKAFIDYLYSDEGAAIVTAAGYIPLPRP